VSFFDEVETQVANQRFLQAQEDSGDISLNLAEYADLKEFEAKTRAKLSLRRLLRPHTVGYYLFKQFLVGGEQKGDLAVFLGKLDEYRREPCGTRRVKAQQLLADCFGIKDFAPSRRAPNAAAVRLPGEVGTPTTGTRVSISSPEGSISPLWGRMNFSFP
jgi:hypothetical protein